MPGQSLYTHGGKATVLIGGYEIEVVSWEIQMPDDNESIYEHVNPPRRSCLRCGGTGKATNMMGFDYDCLSCRGTGRVLDIGHGPRGEPGPVGEQSFTDEYETNAPTSEEQAEDFAAVLGLAAAIDRSTPNVSGGFTPRTERTEIGIPGPRTSWIRGRITQLITHWLQTHGSGEIGLQNLVDDLCELVMFPIDNSKVKVDEGRVEHLLDVIEEATNYAEVYSGRIYEEDHSQAKPVPSEKYETDTVEFRLLRNIEHLWELYKGTIHQGLPPLSGSPRSLTGGTGGTGPTG